MSKSIQFFCPRWGSEDLSWDEFFIKAKDTGYDGVEFGISSATTQQELEAIWNSAGKQNMLLIAQQYDTYQADFTTHKKAFAAWFEKLRPFQPLFINSQTGKDFFSFSEHFALFEVAAEYTAQTGIPVYHETHRNKCLFAANIAKRYLTTLPALPITLDMSHWVCVAESLLEDQQEAMQLASQHTAHIHARVGYPEGPQVSDPFLPEWQQALEAHLKWWDKIVEQKQNEHKPITITPEFGPYPYMVHLPKTNKPIADQWSINVNMMNMLKDRYKI